MLVSCSPKVIEKTKYEFIVFDPPEVLLNERFVEQPKSLKTNRDLVNLLAKYKLQLDLSNDDKKALKMYVIKMHETKKEKQDLTN